MPLQVWGTGKSLREFVFSEDIARLAIWMLDNYDDSDPLILSNSQESSIRSIVELIVNLMNFSGEVVFDTSKPDGQYRKPSDSEILKIFHPFDIWGQVLSQQKVLTKTLDSISEIEQLDFLKIDIQGGKLNVFQHGKKKLTNAVAIQTEVSFIPLYEGQPTFGAVDIELRGLGFIPHSFPAIKNWMIAPLVINGDPRIPLNQLIEADIVYVKDFTKPENIGDEQLKHLALISHICYKSFDLAMRCIAILEERGAVPSGSFARYPAMIG
jgi:hypothetical protein